jgi:iron-sulfur cluster assembly protein
MILLSPEAVAAVQSAKARVGKPQAGLRVMIETGGCAGHKYLIGLDEEPRSDDAVIECGGVKVFVDPDSQPLIAGLRVDFVERLEGAGFAFDNPNSTSTCSCGKSFR